MWPRLLLLLALVALAHLAESAHAFRALQWVSGSLPENVEPPFAVRVSPKHVRRWVRAAEGAAARDWVASERSSGVPHLVRHAAFGDAGYGLTRIGPREFVVGSLSHRRNAAAAAGRVLALPEHGLEAWATVETHHRVHAPQHSSKWVNCSSLTVTFAPGFLHKRGFAKIASAVRERVGAHHVVPSGPNSLAAHGVDPTRAHELAHGLARSYPEILSVGPRPRMRRWTVYGLQEMVGAAAAGNASLGVGLTRGVMDLSGFDTTHCFFCVPNGPPVLYASVGAVPVRLTLNGHPKIAAYVGVCTDQSSACSTQTLTNPNQGSLSDTHATHVAGIAVGQPCASHQGVAPGARILFLSVPAGAEPDTLDVPSDIYPALQTAVWGGATSLSMSFGGPCDGVYDELAAQVDAFAPILTTTVAAGNCGDDGALSFLSSPAVARNVLSVGAALLPAMAYAGRGFSGALSSAYVASFTSTQPIIAAPGVGVLSSLADPGAGFNHATFTIMSGTSMAAPGVTVQAVEQALAAYGWVAAPPVLVRATLVAAGVPCAAVVTFSGTQSLLTTQDPATKCGFGVPQFSDDFWVASDPAWQFSVGSATNTTTLCFSVEAGASVNASLVWDEPPHAPGSGPLAYEPQSLYLSVPGAFASQEDAVANHKRVSAISQSSGYARVTIVSQLAEAEAEYGPGASAASAVNYALVVRGVTAPAPLASCGLCSTQEPARPCVVDNGLGASKCLDSTTGFGPCLPTACDSGYMFAPGQLACVVLDDSAANDALCVQPLAFNGTECVCLSATITCPGGSTIACGPQGYAPCPAVPDRVDAAAEYEYSNGTTPTPPVLIESLVIGGSIATALVGLFFIAYSYVACASMSNAEDGTAVFTSGAWAFDIFVALCGFTGCLSAALAVPTLFVWLFLLLFMYLAAYRVFLARLAVDAAAGDGAGPLMRCVPRSMQFWVVCAHSIIQITIGAGVYLGFTNLEYAPGWWFALTLVLLVYGLVIVALLNASRALLLVGMGAVAVVFIVAACTQTNTTAFVILLIIGILIFALFALQCRVEYTELLEENAARRRSREDARIKKEPEPPQPLPALSQLSQPLVSPGAAMAAATPSRASVASTAQAPSYAVQMLPHSRIRMRPRVADD